MKATTLWTALVAISITLATTACGGSATSDDMAAAEASSTTVAAPTTTEPATPALAERPTELVDELVRIDNGKLHLRCVGSGRTTVLLLAGWGDAGDTWDAMEPAIAERARVCSYSRFGTGTSDAPASIQTFETQAADLHAALEAAGEPGPYVVLGHSFGGAEAVTFASAHRDEVSGLVLLDATPTGWPDIVCSVPAYAGGCTIMRDPALDPERLDVFPAFEQVATITSLGDLPLTVVTAAHREPAGLTPDELARLDALWADGMRRWAALSTSSTVVTVEDTGHHIEVDQPELVTEELLKLVP
jgi:pimeloyl-ACP methyl ester carboxylesterase